MIDTDIAAIEAELQALQPAPSPTEKSKSLHAVLYRQSFHARLFITSLTTLTAYVDAHSSALVKTSARSWTTRPAGLPLNAMSVASGMR
jgi:hypothetical protein